MGKSGSKRNLLVGALSIVVCLWVTLPRTVEPAHQTEGLRVDRVDTVRIDLDTRVERTRRELEVGHVVLCRTARGVTDHTAHVVDQIERPRVLLVHFLQSQKRSPERVSRACARKVGRCTRWAHAWWVRERGRCTRAAGGREVG